MEIIWVMLRETRFRFIDELLYKWVAFPILKMEERTLMTKSLDQ